MPLTPADVHNVAFKKPPIGKRGYAYYLTKGSFHDETLLDAVSDLIGDAHR